MGWSAKKRRTAHDPGDWKLALASFGGLSLLMVGSMYVLSNAQATLTFVGILVTAAVSLVSLLVTRQFNRRNIEENARASRRLVDENARADKRLQQEHRDEEQRLKLDAAMRAGVLFTRSDGAVANRATVASGLLALTRLDQPELAVALLVDLWSDGSDSVSTETAVLVIDAALRSGQPTAQLVAAELLCRHAKWLSPCQSLHWPSVIDGGWDPSFGPKTKLLLIDALMEMTLKSPPNQNALRSVAVRLYGMWNDDPVLKVRGCVATLIRAIVPAMTRLGYTNFPQGGYEVRLNDLVTAAKTAKRNDDEYLYRIVADRAVRLETWAADCSTLELGHGILGTACHELTSVGVPERLAATAV